MGIVQYGNARSIGHPIIPSIVLKTRVEFEQIQWGNTHHVHAIKLSVIAGV
jgi:hypothetical protein